MVKNKSKLMTNLLQIVLILCIRKLCVPFDLYSSCRTRSRACVRNAMKKCLPEIKKKHYRKNGVDFQGRFPSLSVQDLTAKVENAW